MRKLNEVVEFTSGSPQFRITEVTDEHAICIYLLWPNRLN